MRVLLVAIGFLSLLIIGVKAADFGYEPRPEPYYVEEGYVEEAPPPDEEVYVYEERPTYRRSYYGPRYRPHYHHRPHVGIGIGLPSVGIHIGH